MVLLGILLLVGAGVLYGWTRYQAQQAAAAAEAEAAAQVETLEDVIWASGKLTPVTWAGLSPAQGGLVALLHVHEGQSVAPGTVLLELDNSVLAAQVEVARAAVAEAEAALANLKAGAGDAQISAAEAEVAAAEAAVSLAAGQMLEAQAAVDSAAAQVTIAERQYTEAASHPIPAEVDAANARVSMAQAGVEQAQAAYNLVRGDPEIGAMPQSQALRAATAALEAAEAEAAFVTNGPTEAQLLVLAGHIDAAAAAVAAAESRLPGAEAAVASALARQSSAQAALDALLAGADAEELAMAEAHVTSARAALSSAEALLRQTQVVAPFAGTVGAVNTRPGEMAMPGQPLILLGDVGALHVETTDLRETDVVRLALDMPVELSFDALPDERFVGRITRIAPISNTDKGSTNFTVHVEVDDLHPDLRWGMTAFVNISPDE
jgi:HlyD family secretion protein